MGKASSVKGLFQDLTAGDVSIVQGTVISASPLRIQIEGDDKLQIGPNITYVPAHLKDYETTADIEVGDGTLFSQTHTDGSHSHSYSGSTDVSDLHSHSYSGETQETAHSHALASFALYGAKIKIHNALRVGDRVHILSLNHGKQYYVLDRVV